MCFFLKPAIYRQIVAKHFQDQLRGPMGYAKQHHEYYTLEIISKHAKVVIGLPPWSKFSNAQAHIAKYTSNAKETQPKINKMAPYLRTHQCSDQNDTKFI